MIRKTLVHATLIIAGLVVMGLVVWGWRDGALTLMDVGLNYC